MAIHVLVIQIHRPVIPEVGRFGPVPLEPGRFLYVGSAKRAWRRRVGRHLADTKQHRWHIDQILHPAAVAIHQVWVSADAGECTTARHLCHSAGPGAVVRPGLGSSDCRCPAHFFAWSLPLEPLQRSLWRRGFHLAWIQALASPTP